MDFEEEYIKNNGKEPEQDWYDKAYASQTILLLADRLGLTKLGQMALNKTSKKIATPTAVFWSRSIRGYTRTWRIYKKKYLTCKKKKRCENSQQIQSDGKFTR